MNFKSITLLLLTTLYGSPGMATDCGDLLLLTDSPAVKIAFDHTSVRVLSQFFDPDDDSVEPLRGFNAGFLHNDSNFFRGRKRHDALVQFFQDQGISVRWMGDPAADQTGFIFDNPLSLPEDRELFRLARFIFQGSSSLLFPENIRSAAKGSVLQVKSILDPTLIDLFPKPRPNSVFTLNAEHFLRGGHQVTPTVVHELVHLAELNKRLMGVSGGWPDYSVHSFRNESLRTKSDRDAFEERYFREINSLISEVLAHLPKRFGTFRVSINSSTDCLQDYLEDGYLPEEAEAMFIEADFVIKVALPVMKSVRGRRFDVEELWVDFIETIKKSLAITQLNILIQQAALSALDQNKIFIELSSDENDDNKAQIGTPQHVFLSVSIGRETTKNPSDLRELVMKGLEKSENLKKRIENYLQNLAEELDQLSS